MQRRLTVSRERAAELLDISTRTIDRHVADGSLEVTRIGGRVLIMYSSIERLVAAGRAAGGAQ